MGHKRISLLNKSFSPNWSSQIFDADEGMSGWLVTEAPCTCCCSVAQLCLTLCDPVECSMPGLPVPHHLLEFAHVHIHCIGDGIQPSHPLTPSSPSACTYESSKMQLLVPPTCS